MKKFVLALVAAAIAVSPLGGCAQFQKFEQGFTSVLQTTVTQRQAYLSLQGFDAIKIVGTNYLDLRRCNGTNEPFCRDPKYTRSVIAAIDSGTSSRNNLKADLRRNIAAGEDAPITAVADYNGLQAATATIESITAAYRAAAAAR